MNKNPSSDRGQSRTNTAAVADRVWRQIVNHSGESFQQVRGKQFTYEARGRTIYLHTTNRIISRAAVEKALSRWPLERVSDVQDLSAPSYLYAILTDRRIG
ncbi:MAG: hypothetical protein QNL12_14650 [Acidimicrobiia bacterium]|nr:hypothetical protein [Acidimicrobiia bacterium]